MRARILCLAAPLALLVACGGEETPTCSDAKQNGAETDVDCGGTCPPCADGLKCGGAADCGSNACGGGVCLKSLARPCGAPAECASGFCADGVCCGTACGGLCRSCNAAGSAGACTLAPAGTDPKAQCPDEGAASCGLNGQCDGAGACRLYAAATQCAAAVCVDALTAQPARTCDGAGTCVVPATVACQPLVCSVGACLQTCGAPGTCAPGYECAGGFCLKVQGGTCSAPAECASSFCADGFCCESACSGTCERCDQSGREGFCDATPGGTDLDDECATEPVASCGLTGSCSGARACALYPAGTTCLAAVCSGNTSNLPDTCNGGGTCVDGGTSDCAPYLCAASGLCTATCVSSAECTTGFYCSAQGQCVAKLAQGLACGADEQCLSAFCTDGVCCDARCDGICKRCNQQGKVGTCDLVQAGTDPDNDCPQQAVSTCGTSGSCSGTGTCELYQAGTVCQPASCSGSTLVNPDLCSGSGTCFDMGTTSCSPYACSGSACLTSCSVDAHCDTAFYACAANHQCLKKDGQTCSGDTQCAHEHCCSQPPFFVDSFCRNLATDPDYCGSCTQACGWNGVAQRLCTGGACTPQCSAGRLTCDNNGTNGCEVDLSERPVLERTCLDPILWLPGRLWSIGGRAECNTGFLCSSTAPNGFDATPGYTLAGSGSRLLLGRAESVSGGCGQFQQLVRLTNPPDADYDLYFFNADVLYGDICAAQGSSTNVGLGVPENVNKRWEYSILALPTYYVEIRWKSGGSCGPTSNWKLEIFGASCP